MYKIPKKKARLREGPIKDKKYLNWLHNQGLTCTICSRPNIELHHLDQGAKGRADNRVVPLCPECHRGSHSPHGAYKRDFEAEHMDIMEEYASNLYKQYKGEELE